MIIKGSRYAAQPVLSITDPDGAGAHLTVYAGPRTYPRSFTYYQVKDGDRFDLLAFRFLGDASRWWSIADANPEVFYPDELQTGSILRIPSN